MSFWLQTWERKRIKLLVTQWEFLTYSLLKTEQMLKITAAEWSRYRKQVVGCMVLLPSPCNEARVEGDGRIEASKLRTVHLPNMQ